MAARIVKELYGFSGTQILLMKKHDMMFVRKTGDVQRNVERMYALSEKYPLPKIYGYSKNNFDMEYIHSLDIKTYLKTHHYEKLLQFLVNFLELLSELSTVKDYTQIYIDKLNSLDLLEMPFTKEELLDKLPKILPCTEYHGDLTLENILYSEDRGFLLIDCQTTEYDSHIFDIAKLRQDLECGWFTRRDNTMLDVKTKHIQQELLKRFPEADNNYLLIMMLLRVYRYSKPETFERQFLLDWINKLWK